MKVGFTGTRAGMAGMQAREALKLLVELAPEEIHHGDCVGADEEVHGLVVAVWPVVLHPPSNRVMRAFCAGAEATREPLPYLERNRAIVDETDLLVAGPGTTKMPKGDQTGGTWYTVRYAIRVGRPVLVVWRDGQVTRM